MGKIVVIGSSNTDMVVKAERIPVPGETILGGSFFMNQGGKGANQAVAVARMGSEVIFVSQLGDDIFGKNTLNHFKEEGMVTKHVHLHPTEPSGTALITLSQKGENAIVVAPGANNALGKKHIDSASQEITAADFILMQLEIPLDVVEYAAHIAHENNTKVILNPAPAQQLSDELYQITHIITPNETEAELLTGVKVTNVDSAKKAAEIFRNKGVNAVIITLGSQGAFVMDNEYSGLLPGRKVKAMDTTAAGDTFNGALTSALGNGSSLKDAVMFANRAASISVTKLGAQKSIPLLDEVLALEKTLKQIES